MGNAIYAGVQHFVSHLAPTGVAGFVMANGSMASNQSGVGEIRQRLVEADLVDCMIVLPDQLFYTTGIPVCLWFLTREKKSHRLRDRRGQTLFIDARKLGSFIDRTHCELSDDEIARVARPITPGAARKTQAASTLTPTRPASASLPPRTRSSLTASCSLRVGRLEPRTWKTMASGSRSRSETGGAARRTVHPT